MDFRMYLGLLVGFFCASPLIFASQPTSQTKKNSERHIYANRRGAGIKNNSKESISWFTSVIQVLRGTPEFRKYCAGRYGKKNAIKKELNQIFYALEKNKNKSYRHPEKTIKFLIKQAKKSKIKIKHNPIAFANYLLEKSGMQPLRYIKRVTICDNNYNYRTAKYLSTEPKITFDYMYDNNFILNAPVLYGDSAPSFKQYFGKRSEKGISKDRLFYLCKKNGTPLSAEIKKIISKKPSFNDIKCTFEMFFTINDKASVPRLLPIHLPRWQKGPLGIAYNDRKVEVSKILKIILQNDSSKVACYELVSMLVTHSFANDDGEKTYAYPFACLISGKKGKSVWTFYDNESIHDYKRPQHSYPKGLKIPYFDREDQTVYEEAARRANLFFYQFTGFETLKKQAKRKIEPIVTIEW